MTTQAVKKPASEKPPDFEQKLQKLRELYADASEISKTALENVIRSLGSNPTIAPAKQIESAGRIGAREGKVSELTVIAPLKQAGPSVCAHFFETLHGNVGNQSVCWAARTSAPSRAASIHSGSRTGSASLL